MFPVFFLIPLSNVIEQEELCSCHDDAVTSQRIWEKSSAQVVFRCYGPALACAAIIACSFSRHLEIFNSIRFRKLQ